MKKLYILSFLTLTLTAFIVFFSFSTSINPDDFSFKGKTFLMQLKENCWGTEDLLSSGRNKISTATSAADYISAYHFLIKSAFTGNAEASYLISKLYEEGKGVEKNENSYLEFLKKSSDNGYATATYELAKQKLNTMNQAQVLDGIQLLKLAADQGSPSAMKDLANEFISGTIVDPNYIEAKKYTEKLAQTGDIDAKFLMGSLLYYGYGVVKDETLGMKNWMEAYQGGSAEAAAQIGYVFYQNEDYVNAEKYLIESCDKNESDGCYWCAELYWDEKFQKHSKKIAMNYVFKAAELSDPRGYLALGNAYLNGTEVTKDKAESIRWYDKAAKGGLKEAMYLLGLLYLDGTVDGSPNYIKASEYLKEAADRGHVLSSGIIGSWYITGNAIPVDYEKAYKYIKFALDSGSSDPVMQYWFGYLHENGYGIKKDSEKAIEWYKKAADQNYNFAEMALGYAYLAGQGVPKDGNKGLGYLYTALVHGLNKLADDIALYYYNNNGDIEDVYAWYVVSKKLGNEENGKMQDIYRYISPAQQKSATEKANSWLLKIDRSRQK